MSTTLAAAPVAALLFVGVVITFLGVFAGGIELVVLGIASLVASGVIGALAGRHA